MKVICVMCGRIVREAPPRNEADIAPGICEECREGIGSQQRDPEVNMQNSWLGLESTGEPRSTARSNARRKLVSWIVGAVLLVLIGGYVGACSRMADRTTLGRAGMTADERG